MAWCSTHDSWIVKVSLFRKSRGKYQAIKFAWNMFEQEGSQQDINFCAPRAFGEEFKQFLMETCSDSSALISFPERYWVTTMIKGSESCSSLEHLLVTFLHWHWAEHKIRSAFQNHLCWSQESKRRHGTFPHHHHHLHHDFLHYHHKALLDKRLSLLHFQIPH